MVIARDYFYFVQDIMEMLNTSRSKSYKIIHDLNKELESQGYMTVAGRVSKYYCHKRLFCGPEQLETTSAKKSERSQNQMREKTSKRSN